MTEPSATGDWPTRADAAAVMWPTLPGYEFLEELGRGGMGVVYKARQTGSNRLVALKLIRDGALASPQERARFRVEADAAGRMQHPNIVRIFETGEYQGQPFFAMEFIPGGTLDKHLNGSPMAAVQAAELIRTLSLAVQHAHEQRIVHRDLKPANVLLRFDGSPVITDFGLAKRLDAESTALTQTGAVLGTASYMAPEQAAGRIDEIGPAVDLYALGAILYELLTGRKAFQGDSFNQTIQQVINDEPPLPTRLQPDLPRDLETVCLKCLEKDPARRYATARELADELGRFLDSQPIAAVPADPLERLSRLASRDGYQLVSEIGRGSSGTVYRALYGSLKQAMAVKVFPAGSCPREEWDARVRRSADLWAGLVHPHIVPIQRTGWWDGAPYLAEEFVPQGSLAEQIAGRPQPVLQSLRMLEQLAEVVSYIHRQGASHGNLKPTNVLLAADGIPRLVDFIPPVGLLPLSAGDAYRAPELVSDPAAEPRPHTDIFGLGVIFYEMLTGRAPYTSSADTEEPAPPTQFNRAATPAIDKLCLRCLLKNPWHRGGRVYEVLKQSRFLQENPDGGSKGDRKPPR